ncbi:MAG: quorum-sensing autoinducer CAI-1 synthase [Salinisphaera sp.]|jgi:CAI-1 autoinducer synthase|nr:quorum-sensing autoinducer CAI-1 synthase [Salinisphaera sp.]
MKDIEYQITSPVEPTFLSKRVDSYLSERVANWGGGHILHGIEPSPGSVMMVSNDYLHVANHPEIIRAQVDCLQNTDNTMVMSAVYLHGDTAQTVFERDMATWMGRPSALLCQSGYAANVGLIQSISAPDTPVYIDMFAHTSLWEGIRSAEMQPRPYRHNDLASLESSIVRHGPGIVMLDSVYSTNGSVAPMRETVEVAKRYGCVIIVDESHSLGTHGPAGAGIVAELGLNDDVHFVTASLAKTFAGRAGIIVCSERLRFHIKYNSFPGIFSSALLPPDIAALSKTLEIVKSADLARAKVQASADYLRTGLDALGYNVDISHSQIIALEAGREQDTMKLRDALEARGVFGSVFCAPATAFKRSLIRLSVNAGLTHEDLDHVLAVCGEIRDEVDMASWPSTKRKQKREQVSMRAVS